MDLLRRHLTLSGLALAGCGSLPTPADPAQPQQAKRLEVLDAEGRPRTVRFWVHLPNDYSANGPAWPMVFFLHGSGERGTDMNLVKVHGPPKQVEQGRDLPFVLVSPQLDEGRGWDAVELQALNLAPMGAIALDTTGLLSRYLDGPTRPIALAAMAADPDWCASALALSEALMLVDRLGDDPQGSAGDVDRAGGSPGEAAGEASSRGQLDVGVGFGLVGVGQRGERASGKYPVGVAAGAGVALPAYADHQHAAQLRGLVARADIAQQGLHHAPILGGDFWLFLFLQTQQLGPEDVRSGQYLLFQTQCLIA